MTFRRVITTLVGSMCLAAGLGMSAAVGAEQAAEPNAPNPVRVGTFDSRAIAVAYARSALFADRLKALRAEYEEAKKEGDEERVQQLEATGRQQQELLHKQGFSTWPVDNILERIEDTIPSVADRAGVDLIVSKWQIAFQRPGMKCVDVTDLMVRIFQPDEKTLKVIQDLRKHRPVPLEELKKDKH